MDINTVFGTIVGIFLIFMLLLVFYLFDKNKDNQIRIKTLNNNIGENNKALSDYQNLIKQQQLQFDKDKAEIQLVSNKLYMTEIEKFKGTELEKERERVTRQKEQFYKMEFEAWKKKFEAGIRKDAKWRSYSTQKGKSAENFVPFHAKFPFNSQDARFIGSPIDLIVFDGLSEASSEIFIYIMEIKTGTSKLSRSQLRIKNAVDNGRVSWQKINADDI